MTDTMTLRQAIESLRLKFTSGNSVPADRATVTREEFDAINAAIKARDAAVPVAWRYRHPTDGDVGSWWGVNDYPIESEKIRQLKEQGCVIELAYAAPPAQPKGATHCDSCGCTWLDDGLNPVGCPYCKPAQGEPVAWQIKRNPADYPDDWRECTKEVFDLIRRTGDSLWIGRALFKGPQPPAQEKDEPCWCDQRGDGEPGVSCGDCPRDYRGPPTQEKDHE